MAEGEFRFKRFSVRNRLSAMKVNTDGVILGAAVSLTGSGMRVLDIGTGTGTIALMIAQRLSALQRIKADGLRQEGTECGHNGPVGHGQNIEIVGIDIDGDSATEAQENFERSPWAEHLEARHSSLAEFETRLKSFGGHGQPGQADRPEAEKFDLICSNPPYYFGELKAPDPKRAGARHSDSLSWKDIILFARQWLSAEGLLALVLPADQERDLVRFAASQELYPSRILRIQTVPGKDPRRIVAEFTRRRPAAIKEEQLTIQDNNSYTPEYQQLLKDFLVIF